MKRFIHEVTEADYERAAQNGITREQAYGRMYYSGWDVDSAVTYPIKAYAARDPWVQVAQRNGIHRNTYRYRVQKGMPPEEAATKPPEKVTDVLDRIRLNRKNVNYTQDHVAVAAIHGISYVAFTQRVKRGMPPEEACTKPVRTYMKRGY